MIAYLIEEIELNIEWRYKINLLIRSAVTLSLLALLLFAFNSEWQEIKPITGTYNEYIIVQGTAVKDDIRILEKTLKKLPKWLVESHKENGGKINLRSEAFPESDYTEYGAESRVIGTFQMSNNCITILNEKELIESTLFHEYGHYVDKLFSISVSEDFEKTYQEEKENYFNFVEESNYHISCKSEYFAGAFTMYFMQGKKLKKYCPATYGLIEKIVERN